MYSWPRTNTSSSATAAMPWRSCTTPMVARMMAAPTDVPAAIPCLTVISPWVSPARWDMTVPFREGCVSSLCTSRRKLGTNSVTYGGEWDDLDGDVDQE